MKTFLLDLLLIGSLVLPAAASAKLPEADGPAATADAPGVKSPAAPSAAPQRNRAVELYATQLTPLLRRYVVHDRVDYKAWSENSEDERALGDFITRLSGFDPKGWPEADQVAYWINLYNAVTMKLILDHYPLDSIKDLGGLFKSGPWSRDLVEVAEEALSLNEIENDKLRPATRDARIHFAINCASRGCPPLRSEAYLPARLDAQLEAATRYALHHDTWLWIDGNTVHLSKLFDWYTKDFVEDAGSLRAFLARYRDDLPPDDFKIEFMDYSWVLNDIERTGS